jgi:lipopolysaccharide export system permease protein
MNIINRYLAREVHTTMLVVIMVLLAIFLSNQFVHYMHSAAIGNLSGKLVRMLLLLHLPILSAMLLPASLFFAILLAYGRLYADSEMTILISCGISPARLLFNTLYFSISIILFITFLTLFVNPKFYKYSDRILATTSSASSLEVIKPNSFTPVAKDKWKILTAWKKNLIMFFQQNNKIYILITINAISR